MPGFCLAFSSFFTQNISQLRVAESDALVYYLFKNPSAAYAKGITVNTVKYSADSSNYNAIYGRRESGPGGVAIVRLRESKIFAYRRKACEHPMLNIWFIFSLFSYNYWCLWSIVGT